VYNAEGAKVYDNSLLKERSSNKIEDDDRTRIALEAIELAKNEPIFGYGPGNAMHNISTKTFTHNTFLELLVNAGVIGVIIFTYLILYFLRTQYVRWSKTKDYMFLLYLIFGIFWAIDQFFYVLYTDLWLISFFILVATHSDTYYKAKQTLLITQ
jgi:O-antigen ligase